MKFVNRIIVHGGFISAIWVVCGIVAPYTHYVNRYRKKTPFMRITHDDKTGPSHDSCFIKRIMFPLRFYVRHESF